MQTFLMPESSEADVGPLGTEILALESRPLSYIRPKAPDRLLDLESVAVAHDKDQYMPYWAALWPVATYLAHTIDRTKWTLPIKSIELGCGLGLPGLAALSCGINVTFTDYDATALRLVAQSVGMNGMQGAQYLHFDWRSLLIEPIEKNLETLLGTFDLVIASDLIYEERQVKPLVAAFKKLMKSSGVIFLADQDRPYRDLFLQEIFDHGFQCKKWQVPKQTVGSLDVTGSVYILSLKASTGQIERQKKWVLPPEFSELELEKKA
jgi:predicted nicotinamide N-methyase